MKSITVFLSLYFFINVICISQNVNNTNVSSLNIEVTYAGISEKGILSSGIIKKTKYLSIKNDSLNRYDIISFIIGGCCLSSYFEYKMEGNSITQEVVDLIVNCEEKEFLFGIHEVILFDKILGKEFEYGNVISIKIKK